MSEEEKTVTQEVSQTFRFSDDVIIMIRELLQLSLLTGTNILDHLRGVEVEVAKDDPRFVKVTDRYVESYNNYITELNRQAEEMQKQMQETLVDA